MQKVKLNRWFIYAVLTGIFVLLPAVLTFFSFQNGNKIARAGTGDNVSGFAWSENIGWISFNSTDCDANQNSYLDGGSIAAVDTVGDVGKSTSIAIGSDGLPVISYYDVTNGDLKFMKCGNSECSKNNIINTLDSNDDMGYSSSVAIGKDGYPVISYLSKEFLKKLKFIKCNNYDCSLKNSPVIINNNVDVAYGFPRYLAVNNNGNPAITYEIMDELYYTLCGNNGCSSGNQTYNLHIDNSNNDGESAGLVMGSDNIPTLINVAKGGDGSIRIVRCGNESCSSGNNTQKVGDITSYGSSFFVDAITAGRDGYPIAVYYSPDKKIKYIKCNNSFCSSYFDTAVDSLGSGDGRTWDKSPDIARGSDGFSIISYYDNSADRKDLKFIKCNNDDCTNRSTTIIDSEGDAGLFSSIAVGIDGFPIISYYDWDKGDLKVAKCLNLSCTLVANRGCGGDDATVQAFDYGVNIDQATGNFSGYGWSSNIGWVSFEGIAPDYTFNNSCPSCTSANNCTACYSPADSKIYGWGKVLSLGDDGWLKMADDSVPSWNGKGVKINPATGDFFGWAWNGNTTAGTGIGWVSFNSRDCDIDGDGIFEGAGEAGGSAPAFCPESGMAYPYKVYANGFRPAAPANLTATSANCAMRLDWLDNSDDEIGFEAEYSPDGLSGWANFCNVNPNINYCTDTMPENTTYYFRVRALGWGANSDWEPASGGVQGSTPWCPPVLTVDPNSANCDSIELSWTYYNPGVDHYEVWRDKDNEGAEIIQDGIPPSPPNYTDTDIISGSSYDYYVKAQNENVDSNTVSNVSPCPRLPSWKEVKPNP